MHPLILQDPVVIHGRDFFGRKSSITFEPFPFPGLYWRRTYATIAVSPILLGYKSRRLCFSRNGDSLEVVEHILPLSFAGLSNVAISCSGPRPPYHGSMSLLWKMLRHKCITDVEKPVKTYTVNRPVIWVYPKTRNGHRAFTKIEPPDNGDLTLDVTIDYPGIPRTSRKFVLPHEPVLTGQIFSARPQGLSGGLHDVVTKIASKVGWPHRDCICWASGSNPEEVASEWVRHRALDLLGALGVLCFDGIFVGKVTSHLSGHEADFHAVKEAFGMITPRPPAR